MNKDNPHASSVKLGSVASETAATGFRGRGRSNTPDRLPPHSPEAEQGVLGCILLSPEENMPVALRKLTGLQAFYDLRHAKVFQAMAEMHGNREPIDPITLHQRLKDKGVLEQVGGMAFLATLPDAVPSAANLAYYLDIVEEKAQRRKILRFFTEGVGRIYDHGGEVGTLLHQFESDLQSIIRNGNRKLPDLVDAAQFIAQPLEKPSELIQGILHKGSKLVLGGGSKSFKTWTLLDLGLSVSHELHWLGFDTEPGRVLYCNFEIQPWSWQHRLNAVAQARGVTIEPGRLSLWNLRGKAANFNLLLPQIRERVRQDFALIILDPIYKLYGQTDENKASDVARLLNAIEDLAVETGAAVAFGAHFSKGNQSSKESIDRISGSGVFARDPDSLLIFTKHETEDAFTVEATLRNFAPVEPFVVRWQSPLMTVDGELDPARLKKAGGRPVDYDPADLLRLLPAGGLDNKDWKQAADDDGISERSYYRLRKALLDANRVSQDPIGSKWRPINVGAKTS